MIHNIMANKTITSYFGEEIKRMRGYIINYLNTLDDEIDQIDGFNLGVLYSEFHLFVFLLKNEPFGNLTEGDQAVLNSYKDLLEYYDDLLDYIIGNYEKDLQQLKENKPEEYYKFQKELMHSRGFSTN